jgi:hypothetical protein
MSGSGGSGEGSPAPVAPGAAAPPPADTAAPPAEGAVPSTAAADTGTGSDSGAATQPSGTPPPSTGAGNGSDFAAGPGLPKDVANAYDSGKVVALMVVRKAAEGDAKLVPMVEALRSRGDTAVFIVKAFDVARYSRIAQGVNLNRTPALVVVQPKRLTQGPLPEATVFYGYRSKQSVDQQVDDALYDGRRNLPYAPTD